MLLFAALVGLLASTGAEAAPVHEKESRIDLVRRGNPNDASERSGSSSSSSNTRGGKKAVEPAKMHLILVDSAETALEQINALPRDDTASVVFTGSREEASEVYNQVNVSLDTQGGAPNHDVGRRFTRDTGSSENDYMAIYYLTPKMEVRYKGPRLPSHGPASGTSSASSVN